MIKTLILTAFWMFVIPCVLGLGILKFDKKGNKNVFLAIVLGFFVELLVFEFLSVPMTFFGCSFSFLKNSWTIITLLLTITSVVINKNDYKEIWKQNIEVVKNTPQILTVIFVILLLIQCYYPFKYMYKDYDDSNFVAKATIAIDTDSLFIYDDTGKEYEEFPIRNGLSQFPHYTATISELCDIHPTIMAHTIFPVVFLIIVYMFYYVLGMTLFKKDQTKTLIFMNILAILFIYGSYSRYTNFVRILYRAWQGKSILANLTLPFIWYVFIEYIGKEDKNKFGWMILLLALAGSVTLSSMAFILPVITVFVLMAIYAIKDKNKTYAIVIAISLTLSVIVIFVYFKFGNPIASYSALNNDELTTIEKITAFIDGIREESNKNLVQESFDRAGGPRYYIPIFLVAVIYIWVACKKEDKDIFAVFAVFSILIFVLNLTPVFSKMWTMLIDLGTHWRIYWLLPVGYTIAYMCTDLICKNDKIIDKMITASLCIFTIMITGVNVYKSGNFEPVDNYFKIPDWTLEMIFKVSEDENHYKKLAGPEEFTIYTRQVDGKIILAQTRYVWGEYEETSLLTLAAEGKSKEIYEAAIEQKCNYIVVPKTSIKEEDPLTNYGFEILHENIKYVLYKIDFEKVNEGQK